MARPIQTIVFLLFILFVSNTSGQTYLGVFAGLNSSKLQGDAPDNASYKGLMGANVGAHIDFKLSKSIALGIQPSYSQEGTKISYTVSGEDLPVDSIKIRLNYFSLPLILKVTSTNERFYAIAGFETSFLLNSHISSHDITQDIDAKLSELNIALQFGAGLRIPLGYPRMFVELRYSQGLINLTDEPIQESYIPRVKTAGFKVFVGVEIPLKRTNN